MWMQREYFIEGYKNTRLFYQSWQKKNCQGHLIITHGQGEHSESYHRVVKTFEKSNFSIWAWDLRGHGKSEGRRGYVGHFEEYVKDFEIFLNQILPTFQEPIFLLAHSMGALIQLHTQIQFPEVFKKMNAQILSSPLLGLALPVPAWKKVGAEYIHQFLPQITLHNEIKNSDLTRDHEIIQEFEHDPLRHNRISSGAYLGMTESMEFVNNNISSLNIPTLLQISDNDPVISSTKAQQFFEALTIQKTIKIYPEAKHELYNDIIRSQALSDLQEFLRLQMNNSKG